MSRGAWLWNLMAKRYAASPVADEGVYQEKLQRTQKCFTPDSEVLEIGCGTGTTALHHAPHVKHILATDFSKNMLEIAEGKAKDQQVGNVDFKVADVETLALDGKQFDAIVAMNILHLLPNMDRALEKLHSLLKPGGYFISSTVCAGESDKLLLKFFLVLSKMRLFIPLAGFSKKQLTEKMAAAGFSCEEVWSPESQQIVAFVVARKA